jgi:regulator of sigma E protease
MTEAEKRHSFLPSAGGRRAAIVAAGPIANFILAIVIFATIFVVYRPTTTTARSIRVLPRIPPPLPQARRATCGARDDGRTIESFPTARVVSAKRRPHADIPDRSRRRADDVDGDTSRSSKATVSATSMPGCARGQPSMAPGDVKTEHVNPFGRSGFGTQETWSSSTGRSPTSAACSLAANAPTSPAGGSGSPQISGQVARSASCRCCNWRPCCRCRSAPEPFPVPLLDGGHLCSTWSRRPGAVRSAKAQEIGFGSVFGIVVMLDDISTVLINDTMQLLPRFWAS